MRDLLLGIGFGLISAATLSLSAVALSLQYSVTSVPNFAHGELMTVGAYAAYVMQQHTHSVPLELLAAIGAGGLLAYLINGFVLQPYSRRGANTVTLFVLTIVVSFVVQALLELFFGGANVSFALNSDTAFAVGPFLFTTQNLIVIGVALLIMALLHALLMYTPFGKSQRAVADSLELARYCGINAARVVRLTWSLAGAIAGLAGWVLAASIGSFGPGLGYSFLLPTFAAAVVGGIGRPYGAMLGALVVGIATEVSALYILPDYKESIAFGLLIITLLFRPNGLLGVVRPARTAVA